MWLLPVLRKRPMEGLKLTSSQFTVFSLAAIILTSGLAALGYAGTFSRYLADDYCFSRLVIENGFWGAQVKSFVTWSDRFSTVFITDIIDFAGVTGIRFLPLVLMGILLGGMVGSVIRLNRALNLPLTRFEIYLIGALLSYGVLITAPSQFQSVFWRAGSITYLLPLAMTAVLRMDDLLIRCRVEKVDLIRRYRDRQLYQRGFLRDNPGIANGLTCFACPSDLIPK